MTSDKLVSDWFRFTDLHQAESNSHVAHLFSHRIIPKIFPLSFSMAWASCKFPGIRIPNLCVFVWWSLLTALIIISIFLRVKLNHHLNAGSSSICWYFTYSETSIGFDSFKSARRSYVVVPSFHWMQKNHPLVVFLWCAWPLNDHTCISFLNCRLALIIFGDCVHDEIMIAIIIALEVHVLGVDIGRELFLRSIREFDVIYPCIQYWVWMRPSNLVTSLVDFVAHELICPLCFAKWE